MKIIQKLFVFSEYLFKEDCIKNLRFKMLAESINTFKRFKRLGISYKLSEQNKQL